MKVQIDICMELELAGTFEEFENEIMLACDGGARGTYGMIAGQPFVAADQHDIEEISMRLINIAGLKISKVYIENIDIDEPAIEETLKTRIPDNKEIQPNERSK